MKTLCIFIDGVGLGELSPVNPFVVAGTPFLRALLEGNPLCREVAGLSNKRASLLGLDALLEVKGLPQSATGQASLFSGENAPLLLGSHLKGYPDDTLRALLAEKGIFKQLSRKGYRCAFANAYRPPFFELLRRGLPGRLYSCSTLITYYGGVTFRSLDDLRHGKAVYMDIDHTVLQQRENVPPVTPEEAGLRLARLSSHYDFTLFEYFLTDRAGHNADLKEACRVLGTVDRFIGSLVERLDPADFLLVITSDHGNLEDISHKEHTLNPVPALLVGDEKLRRAITPFMKNLTHLLPAVQAALAWPGKP